MATYSDFFNNQTVNTDYFNTYDAYISDSAYVAYLRPYSGSTIYLVGSLDISVDFTVHGNYYLIGNETITGNLIVTGTVTANTNVRTPVITLTGASNQIEVQPGGTGTYWTIRGIGNPTLNRVLTMPDISDGSFLLDTGDQLINGEITFARDVFIQGTYGLYSDFVSAFTTNGDLSLSGNGTGIVKIQDRTGLIPGTLAVDTMTNLNGSFIQINSYIQTSSSIAASGLVYAPNGFSTLTTNASIYVFGNGTGHVNISSNLGVPSTLSVDTVDSLTGTTTFLDPITSDISVATPLITSAVNNTDLVLQGLGTGIVKIADTLGVDTIENYTASTDLTLTTTNVLNKIVANRNLQVTSGHTIYVDTIEANTGANLILFSTLNDVTLGNMYFSQPNGKYGFSTNNSLTYAMTVKGISTNSNIFDFRDTTDTSRYLVDLESSGLNFRTAGTNNVCYFDSSGNVVIGGTSASGYKLRVIGTTQFTTTVNLSTLSAGDAVVTDGSKNLSSLQYTNLNVSSTLVARDSSGVSNFTAVQVELPSAGILMKGTGATSTTIIYPTNPASNRAYTIPDTTNASSSFIMNNGGSAQSISTILNLTNSTASSSTSTGACVITGGLGIGGKTYAGNDVNITSGGLFLPTAGGTPSQFDWYQDTTYTTSFTCRNGSASGTVTIHIVRLGVQVFAQIPAVSFSSGTGAPANTIVAGTAMNSVFRPASNTVVRNLRVTDTTTTTNGLLYITSGGIITFFKDDQLSNFNTSVVVATPDNNTATWTYNV